MTGSLDLDIPKPKCPLALFVLLCVSRNYRMRKQKLVTMWRWHIDERGWQCGLDARQRAGLERNGLDSSFCSTMALKWTKRQYTCLMELWQTLYKIPASSGIFILPGCQSWLLVLTFSKVRIPLGLEQLKKLCCLTVLLWVVLRGYHTSRVYFLFPRVSQKRPWDILLCQFLSHSTDTEYLVEWIHGLVAIKAQCSFCLSPLCLLCRWVLWSELST